MPAVASYLIICCWNMFSDILFNNYTGVYRFAARSAPRQPSFRIHSVTRIYLRIFRSLTESFIFKAQLEISIKNAQPSQSLASRWLLFGVQLRRTKLNFRFHRRTRIRLRSRGEGKFQGYWGMRIPSGRGERREGWLWLVRVKRAIGISGRLRNWWECREEQDIDYIFFKISIAFKWWWLHEKSRNRN